jgi:FkbM family methyltransferase
MARPRPARRAVSWASRRLERPELLAAFYPGARLEWREELAIRAILGAALHPGATYVDVGTNRGQLLAEAIGTAPGAEHVAFEPIPELAAEVERRFPQVDCRRVALSDRPGTSEFWHFRALDGWSGLRRSPLISDEQGDPRRLEVRTSTLDAELSGRRPTLVKIDVEGAELGVLEGGRELLGAVKPLLIVECVPAASELYGATPGAVWDLLHELGYELLPVTGGSPVGRAEFGGPGAINWLARAASA